MSLQERYIISGRDTHMLVIIADFYMTYRGKSMITHGFNAFNPFSCIFELLYF